MPQQFVQNPMNQFESERLPVGWPWRFFMVSFVIFLVSILGYVGLAFGYEPFLNTKVASLDQNITQGAAEVSSTQQQQFIQVYSQIVNLKSLVGDHVFSSNVLFLLQSVTYPQIYYTHADLKTAERTLTLDGVAPTFDILSQQLAVFSQTSAVTGYTLDQSQLNNNQVQFRVTLKLAPSVFSLSS
ncbi:MAG: hypothetical protein KGI60_00095 [Patescibacteria group bacterium]|nr:hypothetical protein [Patescibacteria group bacterium]